MQQNDKIAIIIDVSNRSNVIDILKNHQIKHYEAGYPNGKVTLIETYQSKINTKKANKAGDKEHQKMIEYSQMLGYKDISEAISALGSGSEFRRRFKKEFTKKG